MRRSAGQRSAEIGLRVLGSVTRHVPFRRGIDPFLIRPLLRLRGYRFDFDFHCPDSGVRWSARGFPDLLTRHMLLEGTYQTSVLSTIRAVARRGDVVFDVGGHHGLMALVASQAVGPTGRVVTFEPNPEARDHLERHVTLNGAENVIIEPVVLSDRSGTVPFYVQTGDVSWNSSMVRSFVDREEKIEPIVVATETLDRYVEQTGLVPSLVKIDTEGSEFEVLAGAARTIRTHRPTLIMEFNPLSARSAGTTVREMVESLEALSYHLEVPGRDARGYYRFDRREPFDEARHCGTGVLRNVVCLPL